jgi:DNA-binding MarR family transcriptional regulator
MTQDAQVHELMATLQQMVVSQQRFERAAADTLGMDRTSLEVIYQLIARGSSTPTELAAAAGLSTAATTQVLKRLDGAGHLQRHRHASDRRKVVISVAEQTTAHAEQLFTPLITALGELLEGATPGDLDKIAWFLRSMTHLYDELGRSQRR